MLPTIPLLDAYAFRSRPIFNAASVEKLLAFATLPACTPFRNALSVPDERQNATCVHVLSETVDVDCKATAAPEWNSIRLFVVQNKICQVVALDTFGLFPIMP